MQGETERQSRGRAATPPRGRSVPAGSSCGDTSSALRQQGRPPVPHQQNRGPGLPPLTPLSSRPPLPATPPQIDHRHRQTPTVRMPAACRPAPRSARATPPPKNKTIKGVRSPPRGRPGVGGCATLDHRRAAANPPPQSSYLPSGRSRRRRGCAATAHTCQPPPTRVAPGGGHTHAAAAAAPMGTAGGSPARMKEARWGTGVLPKAAAAAPAAAPKGSGGVARKAGGKSGASSASRNRSRRYSTTKQASGNKKKGRGG